jgi:Protein of Unknown function (DUF2784)
MLTLYRSLADLVFVLHVVFIVFVLFGGLLALRWRLAPMAHLPAAAWGAAVEFFGWTCPLTPLEDALRRAGGSTGSSVGFIERYLVPLVYPAALDRNLQTVLGAVVLAVNLVVYVVVLRRARR